MGLLQPELEAVFHGGGVSIRDHFGASLAPSPFLAKFGRFGTILEGPLGQVHFYLHLVDLGAFWGFPWTKSIFS